MHPAVPRFDQVAVAVVGDVMLDRYWYGDTARISPEAPVPVVRVGHREQRPGGAANVALNLAALGVATTLVGAIGEDEAGRALADAVAAAGVRTHWVTHARLTTVTKLRVMSRSQQLIRLDFEEPPADFARVVDAEAVARNTAAVAEEAKVVVLSDYGKGTLTACAELVGRLRRRGCDVLVDPKGRDWRRYRGASLLTPNLAELEAVVGPCSDESLLVEQARKLCSTLDLGGILLTRSERGMTLIRATGEPLHLPTRAREVFDVTGAGDTVIAAFAAGVAAGLEWADAAHWANVAAGIAVGKLGTATVSVAELRQALQAQRDADDEGVVAEERLAALLDHARARGERVVMTNGCFDILHSGHVRYLEAASRLGERLVVAVNDDASVKRLKGASRPRNALPDRMRVLAALASVDWVVPFSEDTPQRLIERLQPDVLVKGGDYRVDQVAGYESVLARGGRVEILDYYPGYSTTAILSGEGTGSAGQ